MPTKSTPVTSGALRIVIGADNTHPSDTGQRFGATKRRTRSKLALCLDHCAVKTWATAPPLNNVVGLTGSIVCGVSKRRAPPSETDLFRRSAAGPIPFPDVDDPSRSGQFFVIRLKRSPKLIADRLDPGLCVTQGPAV